MHDESHNDCVRLCTKQALSVCAPLHVCECTYTYADRNPCEFLRCMWPQLQTKRIGTGMTRFARL